MLVDSSATVAPSTAIVSRPAPAAPIRYGPSRWPGYGRNRQLTKAAVGPALLPAA
jgi:hypothetical protein